MSVITDPLPETVKVGGRFVLINTDFRAGIRLEQIVLEDEPKPGAILTNYFGVDWPKPYDEALNSIMWFYQCGRDGEGLEDETRDKLKNNKRGYDFEVDAEAVYASFWQAYHIDLPKSKMHWWAFRALLLGLPEGTPFMQRVYYRVGSTDGMSKKQKKAFEARRKRYALPERGKITHKLTLMERDEAIRQYVAKRFAQMEGK